MEKRQRLSGEESGNPQRTQTNSATRRNGAPHSALLKELAHLVDRDHRDLPATTEFLLLA
jgi:hypothetical protein